MPLTGDMRRLCDRLAYDDDRRWDAVHAIRENSMRMISDIRHTHAKRADEMIRRMRDLNAFRNRMTAEQRHWLTESRNSLRHDVSEFVGDLQAAHRDRASKISEHIHDLGTARVKMGEEQERMLAEFHADLHDSVEDFVGCLKRDHQDMAEEVSRELHDFRAAREKMSAEQHRRLSEERDRLEATVNQTRKELRADAKRARQVWTDFAAKSRHRGAKGGAVQVETKPAAAAYVGGAAGATAVADDLTVIPGIGPNRQLRLNELGIHSFAQLANTTEAGLRHVLGQSARLADVGKWIEEAKKRARP